VTLANKFFWRRCVDISFFQNILSSSFHHVSSCISDLAVFDTNKMNDVDRSSTLVACMSSNLAEMYYIMKRRERDIFFARFPEVLGFMLVNALHTSFPKHHRLFDSVKFRELLLDWCAEVFGGFRFTNSHVTREWYFADSVDTQINTLPAFPAKRPEWEGVSVTKFSIELSPLIQIYLSDSMRYEKPLTVTLSQLPDRPLMTLVENPYANRVTAKGRRKRIVMSQVRDQMLTTAHRRLQIMQDFDSSAVDATKDIRALRAKLKGTLQKVAHDYEADSLTVTKEQKARRENRNATTSSTAAGGAQLAQMSPGGTLPHRNSSNYY